MFSDVAQHRAVGDMKDPDLFLHKVSALQAGIRGFLVRRQFQSLRAEYEAIVQEIEGDLSTLQWTGGWIPKPIFLPEAKSHRSWKTEKVPNPEQKLCSHFPYKDSKKDVILEEMVLKKAGGSQEKARSLRRDEQGRKASQGKTRDISISEGDNAVTDLELSRSQHELQDQRNHLAMELLWLQQAINSRKEYLILKQTLRSPEASQTRDKPNMCLDRGGQSSCLPKDQSCRDRTTGEPLHADGACHKGDSQLQKSPDSLASTGKDTVGAKGWELCYRKATPQLTAALESQAGGDRVTKGPDHKEQAFNETCLQKLLEGQTPGDPKSKSPCSGKAVTQLPTFCENPSTEDKYSRKPSYKEADCHRDRHLRISEVRFENLRRPHDLEWDVNRAGTR